MANLVLIGAGVTSTSGIAALVVNQLRSSNHKNKERER